MAQLSFVIYTNLCLELILILSQTYFVADKNFTVEKPWIWAALADSVVLFALSICWFLIYSGKRNPSSNFKIALRVLRAIESIFSFAIAVILILLVQKSDLSKACVGYDHGQTPGPCNRFAFIFVAAILATINGMTYLFSPTVDDIPEMPHPSKVGGLRKSPPTYSQTELLGHQQQQQYQYGQPVLVTQAFNPTFVQGHGGSSEPPAATAVLLESDTTSTSTQS